MLCVESPPPSMPSPEKSISDGTEASRLTQFGVWLQAREEGLASRCTSTAKPARRLRMISEALVPKELNLFWQFRVREAINGTQHASVACVESARWNIDVLGFNLEQATTLCLRPLFRSAEERGANAMPTGMRGNAEVPNDC